MTPDDALDADYQLISRMRVLANVHGAYDRYRNAKGDAIHNLNDSDGRVLKWLEDIKVI